MRDEKEEKMKQARSNKQTRQSNTAHPRHMYMYTCMYLYIHTLTPTAILTSFLLHDLPSHIALVSSQVFMMDYVCSFSPLFIRVAHAVHEVVALLPSDSVDAYEREELHWQPRSECCGEI